MVEGDWGHLWVKGDRGHSLVEGDWGHLWVKGDWGHLLEALVRGNSANILLGSFYQEG